MGVCDVTCHTNKELQCMVVRRFAGYASREYLSRTICEIAQAWRGCLSNLNEIEVRVDATDKVPACYVLITYSSLHRHDSLNRTTQQYCSVQYCTGPHSAKVRLSYLATRFEINQTEWHTAQAVRPPDCALFIVV